MLNLGPAELLRNLVAVLLGLTVHEFAHSFVALRLGDDTPRQLGRVTLNPLKHIDLVGFLLLVTAGFGWAKPVVINRDNLKHPVRDDILISLAGPASNLLFAAIVALITKAVFTWVNFTSERAFDTTQMFLLTLMGINVGLALFNLLPIPPLDGSHLFVNLLSARSQAAAQVYFRYGTFLLLGIIIAERVLKVDILPIGAAVFAVVRAMLRLVGLL